MGQVQRRDRRLTDIGVGMSRQRTEPGFHDVDGFHHAGEVAALDDLFDQPQFLVGDARIVVPDRDGRGDIGLSDDVGPELLKSGVGVHRLVVGVGVEKRRGLVGHHLLQDGRDGFALGEPLPPDLGEEFGRVGLVEHDRARRPAVWEGKPIELVEKAGRGRRGEADEGQHAQMRIAEHGLQAGRKGLVGQQGVEVHGNFGHADPLAFGRDRGVQVRQRLGVIEPGAFRHEAFDELENTIGAIDKAAQGFARIGAFGALTALIQKALGARGVFGWRQIEERQEVAGLEVDAFFLEFGLALGIDQGRSGVRKTALRIVEGRMTLRFDEDGPARPQPSQCVVQASGDGDQFGGHGAIEIGAAKARRPLEAAILVEDHALIDERRPGEEVRQVRHRTAIFGQVHHRPASDAKMARDAQMAAHHVDEHRIALRRPNGGGVSDHPKQQPCDPEAKAQSERCSQGAIQDGDGAGRAAEQDRLGQRPMDGRDEALDGFICGDAVHQISAPPPKEKNDRKKLDAANAIDRPKTIWISRRKPPDVSPKASDRPVTMMMITAMILATGPSTDCRI